MAPMTNNRTGHTKQEKNRKECSVLSFLTAPSAFILEIFSESRPKGAFSPSPRDVFSDSRSVVVLKKVLAQVTMIHIHNNF